MGSLSAKLNLNKEPAKMKIARLFGLAFAAVVAIGAIAASTASAIPKFRLPITLRGFAGLSGLTLWRNRANGDIIDCTHDHLIGIILGDDEIDLKEHFLNCFVIIPGGDTCTAKSVGTSAGLILSELILGLLGLLHSPPGAAAILEEPKTGHVLWKLAATEAPCSTPETAFEGTVAGLYSPTGKLSSDALIVTAPVNATGKQEITLILTLAGTIFPELAAFGSETTETSTELLTYEESVEVD
jgi:hypothetical protein